MRWCAVILFALVGGCCSWQRTGSLYRGKHTHVGVRPATDGSGAAVTLQVSTDALP